MILVVFPSLVRRQVLRQHTELRGFLERALAETTRGLRGEGVDREQLVALVRDLREGFQVHLAFEEEALLPVLAALPSFGPEGVAEVSAEHARQRGDLDTLIEGLESGWEMERLALVMRSLITDLLIDMAEEEHACLGETMLGEEVFAYQAPGA